MSFVIRCDLKGLDGRMVPHGFLAQWSVCTLLVCYIFVSIGT